MWHKSILISLCDVKWAVHAICYTIYFGSVLIHKHILAPSF